MDCKEKECKDNSINWVKTLPSKPCPNSIYFLKTSDGVLMYVSSLTGVLIQIGGSSQGGDITITSPDSSITVIQNEQDFQIKVSDILQILIESALQPGDNISTLINNAGYITEADLGLQRSLEEGSIGIVDTPILLRQNIGSNFASVYIENGASSLTGSQSINFATPTNNLNIDSTGFTIRSDSSLPAKYFADYSVNFTNRSLVDKQYVDSQVSGSGFIPLTQKGAINGVVPLNSSSTIDAIYLPSYVDDVLEFNNLGAFPITGETGKIYVARDTNKTYRWSGSAYIEISPSDVNSVAGLTGIITSANLKTALALNNVDNTSDIDKPVSTAQNTAINAKVADAINDGTTTVAPSQNAVFDALVLKENLANKQNNRAIDGTGSKYPTIDIINSSFAPYDDIYPRLMYDQFFKYQATGSGLDATGAIPPTTVGTASNGSIAYGVVPPFVVVNTRKYVTAATAGSSCGLRDSAFNRINTNQGYYFSQRIKNADASIISDVRCFYGLATTGVMANADPSAYVESLVGFAADSADTNMQLMYKQAGIPFFKINLGASFLKTNSDDYFMELWRIKGSSITFYKITNLTNGAMQQGSVTHNSVLTIHNNRNNGASNIVAGIDFIKATLHLDEQY